MEKAFYDALVQVGESITSGDVRALLEALDVCDPNNELRTNGQPLIHHAASRANGETIKAFLDRGVDPNVPDEDGDTPLFNAVANGNIEAAEVLVDSGANVNYPDKKGFTPLMVAAFMSQAKSCRWLIQHGADINAWDSDGSSAISCAARALGRNVPDLETVLVLVRAGADVHDLYSAGCCFAVPDCSGRPQMIPVRAVDWATLNRGDLMLVRIKPGSRLAERLCE